jgi:hypothetical protein
MTTASMTTTTMAMMLKPRTKEGETPRPPVVGTTLLFQGEPGNNFAYCVAEAYQAQFQPLLSQTVQDQRHDETLNLLFAVTYWLHHYHAAWLTNYEVATDLLASLPGHWRRLLGDSTVAAMYLGILEPFTLPGLYAFLAQFQVLVKRVETHRNRRWSLSNLP